MKGWVEEAGKHWVTVIYGDQKRPYVVVGWRLWWVKRGKGGGEEGRRGGESEGGVRGMATMMMGMNMAITMIVAINLFFLTAVAS